MTSIAIDLADGLSSATAVKGPCKVATTANITLSGEQTIDGVAVVTDDRVLVKDQTTASQNGIYVADTGPWRRAKDFAGNRDVRKGTRVWVTQGDNGPAEYVVTTENPVLVGTDDIVFTDALGTIVQANVPIYATKAGMSAQTVPVGTTALRVNGYAAAGDYGDALYKKVVSEPAHAGKFQSSDGAWWELAESEVYLEKFGAVGDGVTNDAAAFAAAAAYGAKRILGRKGAIYGIGATAVLLDSLTGVTFDLRGAKIKLLAVPTTQVVQALSKTSIKFLNCTKSGIIGAEIDGNNIASNAIGFDGTTDCFVRETEIYDCGVTGHIVAAGNTRLKIDRNHIHDGIGTSRGVWLGNGTAAEIETDLEVTFNHVHDSPATGIVFYSNGGRACDNTCEDNAGSGLIAPGGGGFTTKNAVFSRNTLRRNLFHGFQDDVVYSVDADITTGNVIADNICYENDGSGIYLSHAHHTSVTGNQCFDNNFDGASSGNGITLQDKVKNIVISGNNCYETRSGASRTQGDGINIVATLASPEAVSVSGNICRNNLSKGIFVQPNTGQTITGLSISSNQVKSNGAQGIFIAEADAGSILGATVSGNTSLDNTSSDIRISALYVNIGRDNEYVTHVNMDYQTFTDGDTSPSVRGRKDWRASNTGATLITTFDDAPDGHTITVRVTNGNTTFVYNAAVLVLQGAANVTLANNQVIGFQKSGIWREVWRSFSSNLVATATVDPASLATGAATVPATVTVTGAALGDIVDASFSLSLAGVSLHAYVSAADTVTYFFRNDAGANPADLGSGTLKVRVEK